MLGRQNKGSKGMDRPLSPEKKSRTGRNPLRRGPSSRQDMQMLESPPQTSSGNVHSSPPRLDHPLVQIESTRSREPRQNPEEQRRMNDTMNGDAIEPVPNRVSSMPMTNGLQSNRELATVQENRASYAPPTQHAYAPTKPTQSAQPNEVDYASLCLRTLVNRYQATRDAEGYSVPSSAVDDITRAQQEAAASAYAILSPDVTNLD